MVKIIIDSAIPYIEGILEPYADVVYRKGSEITATDVRQCDAMIIRTRTRCDEKLLGDSQVRFIGTATIGHDHIDQYYCRKKAITVATAAGCNALGVVQYVGRAIEELEKIKPIRCIGIVGVGNVGGALNEYLSVKGYDVLLNDPPRFALDKSFHHTPIAKLLKECDLVTLHVPLDNTTRGMVSTPFFSTLGGEKFFINASRGEVVNERALLEAIDNKTVIYPVIDVWCDEPDINGELLEKAYIATPHIAGYSEQGKANGTAMMVQAVAKFFNIEELIDWYPNGVEKNVDRKIVTTEYNIFSDSELLKSDKNRFEELRNNYKYRKEFFNNKDYTIFVP